MSQILNFMRTSALNCSQGYHLRLKSLAGLYTVKDSLVSSSCSVQIKKHKSSFKRNYQNNDVFPMKKEVNEGTLNKLSNDNEEYLTKGEVEELEFNEEDQNDEEANETTLKKLSKDNKEYLTKEELEELEFNEGDQNDEEANEGTLKELSKDNEEYLTKGEVEELDFNEEDQKDDSFITRDEVKEALLEIYGKANDHMLDKIMTLNHSQFEEIPFHKFETQIEKLLIEDHIFQEEFPKRVFFEYDKNKDGKLNSKEIYTVLKQIGEDVDKKRLKTFMKSYDKDEDGYLNYEEFCEFSRKELFPKKPMASYIG